MSARDDFPILAALDPAFIGRVAIEGDVGDLREEF